MTITIKKDGEGFLAEVQESPDMLYAFGYTEQEALRELSYVVEMMMDTCIPTSQKRVFAYIYALFLF